MIKALIAIESSFDPTKRSRVQGSTATGLMQITDQALRVLGGNPDKTSWIEMKSNLVHVEKVDRLDPIINIALGIRLLGHKFLQIPKTWDKNAKSTMRSYYSRGKGGEEYANKIMDLYERSRKK